MKTALIDAGSLKVKCEAREYHDRDHYTVLYRAQERTALVRDLDQNDSMITTKALAMTVQALNVFRRALDEYDIDSVRIIGTEALRRAKNADAVLETIRFETGYEIQSLSQADEGLYFFRAVSEDFPNTVIAAVDIGGGSAQVMIGKDGVLSEQYLFPTGTYVLRTTFIKNDQPTVETLDRAQQCIAGHLVALRESRMQPRYVVYGSTNVIDFADALSLPYEKRMESESLGHNRIIRQEVLQSVLNRIGFLSYAERELLHPSDPFYMHGADMALMNILEVCKHLKVSDIIPSNANVSSGIFLEMAQTHFAQ